MRFHITHVTGQWVVQEARDFKYIPIEEVNIYESFEGLEYTVLIDTDMLNLNMSDDPIIEAFRRGKSLIREKQAPTENLLIWRDELGKMKL